MKKFLALIIALVIMTMSIVTAFAEPYSKHELKFNTDGKFKILNICDIQEDYPLHPGTVEFINEVLIQETPDLVVLGGDNCDAVKADVEAGIEEICNLFVESGTYFTLVFGNHDEERGFCKEDLLEMYKKYGGEYCLAFDEKPELSGAATHSLPIKSSSSDKIAFNLYMIDSNMYVYDENGNNLGWDNVHEDEIEWYKDTAARLKAENGGETVPSMVFQHIVVPEIYDKLYFKDKLFNGKLGIDLEDNDYVFIPKLSGLLFGIKDGFLLEHPCPGYRNYGQLDAMVETGDVLAVFSGHDHSNSFTVNVKGIDIVNSPACSVVRGTALSRGCRVIELDESDLSTYSSHVITVNEMSLKDGSKILDYTGQSKFYTWIMVAFLKVLGFFRDVI